MKKTRKKRVEKNEKSGKQREKTEKKWKKNTFKSEETLEIFDTFFLKNGVSLGRLRWESRKRRAWRPVASAAGKQLLVKVLNVSITSDSLRFPAENALEVPSTRPTTFKSSDMF